MINWIFLLFCLMRFIKIEIFPLFVLWRLMHEMCFASLFEIRNRNWVLCYISLCLSILGNFRCRIALVKIGKMFREELWPGFLSKKSKLS